MSLRLQSRFVKFYSIVRVFRLLLSIVGIACALDVMPVSAADSPRERLSLDAGWKFHLGDKWPKKWYLIYQSPQPQYSTDVIPRSTGAIVNCPTGSGCSD
jgi:hypothetical protein